MRILLVAGVALLSACGGGSQSEGDNNAMATDNMMMDQNMTMDQNMMMDPAAMNGTANMGAGGTVDANTQNMMMKDATSNDADTNLANGL
jgi:hypothetical protein